MKRVAENLERSLQANRRPVWIVCVTKWTRADLLRGLPGFRQWEINRDAMIYVCGEQ